MIIQCEWCGKDVEKALYRVNYANKRNSKMFCNHSCSLKHQKKHRRDNFVMSIEKLCPCCNEMKLLCEFHIVKRNLDGRYPKCKVCRAKDSIQQYKKWKYGMTPEDETEIFESQDRVCAICGCPPPLYIDHNHTTGSVRGLLCPNCNFGLGNFNDIPDNLRKAADYLESEFNEN